MDVKLDFDPYEMLGVDEESTEKEIVKGFRQMALKWHPDKNPSNVDCAKEMFLKIQKAFEILTDSAAKSAFDRLRKAQKAAKARTRQLDEKRRKLKEELESREQNVTNEKVEEVDAERKFAQEVERLRKESSKLLQREKEEIERQVHKERASTSSGHGKHKSEKQQHFRLKILWKVNNNEPSFYDEDKLKLIFSKYGQISALVVSRKKPGSALIEFSKLEEARSAVNNEKGDARGPLVVKWIEAPPPEPCGNSSTSETTTLINHEDFESLVLTKMKQAEERRRLIEKMKSDDVVKID